MGKIILNFPSLATSTNVKAGIRVIREGETWNDLLHPGSELDESAYRVRYGGGGKKPVFFTDMSRHPRIFEPLNDGTGRVSSASGALQWTATTWDDTINRYEGLRDDFSKTMQDYVSIAKFHQLGVLEALVDGYFEVFMAGIKDTWAGMPASVLQDGGRKIPWARAEKAWKDWGGQLMTVAASVPRIPAPISEVDLSQVPPAARQTPPATNYDSSYYVGLESGTQFSQPQHPTTTESTMEPISIISLLWSLFQAFSPVVKAKIESSMAKVTDGNKVVADQVTGNLMGMMQQLATQALPAPPEAAPGVVSVSQGAGAQMVEPMMAIATIKSNPALLAQAEQITTNFFEENKAMLEEVARLDQVKWAAEEKSADNASQRALGDSMDMAGPLLYGGLFMVGLLLTFVCAIIGIQVVVDGEAATEMWAALTGLIGWATAQLSLIYGYRFGMSKTSNAQNILLAEAATKRVAGR